MISDYFKGKICTILTVSVNIVGLNKMETANIFTGVVENINDSGVMMKALNGKKSFFNSQYIVGILEEEVVDSRDAPKPILPKKPNQPLTLDALNEMIKSS